MRLTQPPSRIAARSPLSVRAFSCPHPQDPFATQAFTGMLGFQHNVSACWSHKPGGTVLLEPQPHLWGGGKSLDGYVCSVERFCVKSSVQCSGTEYPTVLLISKNISRPSTTHHIPFSHSPVFGVTDQSASQIQKIDYARVRQSGGATLGTHSSPWTYIKNSEFFEIIRGISTTSFSTTADESPYITRHFHHPFKTINPTSPR